ncbi:MAG: LysR substrate-binding domain-containing protein [Eggerthellaceae bacterium]
MSSQHYNFVANAFADLAEHLEQERYELILNETQTHQVIEDVRSRYADVGILYLSNANRSVMAKAFSDARVAFHPLFTAKPHVFLQRSHPLAGRDSVTLDDLAPYPRINFVQGAYESANFAEELFSFEPCDKSIKVSDRAAVVNFMVGLNAYTISSGIFPRRLHGDAIVSVPLAADEVMGIGYLLPLNAQLGNLGRLFIDSLEHFADSAPDAAPDASADRLPHK